MHSTKALIVAYLKAICLYLLGLFMPDRGKRILLVTTLQMQLARDGIFHEETLDKLNRAMGLAKSNEALLLPAKVYSSVWDHDSLSRAVHEVVPGSLTDICLPYDDARRVSESIVNVAPTWLRYGRREDMVKDLIALFYCQATSPKAMPV